MEHAASPKPTTIKGTKTARLTTRLRKTISMQLWDVSRSRVISQLRIARSRGDTRTSRTIQR